jgi:ectoine hydroxylase-related dioxygenase (phytanoyl-CoA dioxygenase family)
MERCLTSGHVPIRPLMEAGSVLMYDYRTIHRGTSNTTHLQHGHEPQTRRMLYILYTKPWFTDTINFSDISLFDEDAAERMKTQNDIDNIDCPGHCDLENM